MKYSQKKHDLTEGVIWQKLLIFALPILLGAILQSIYTTADAVIIGQFAGKKALAAIESVYTFTKLPINFFVGLSSGATIIISQYYGAKNKDTVSEASHTAIVFAFVGGFLLSIIAILLSPIVIHFLQVPQDISHDAQLYVIIYFSGMAASMTYNIGAGIFQALGNSKTPFYYLVAANLLNIFLDLIIVGVFRLGVIGAALTTTISQFLCAFLILMALMRTNLYCKIYPHKLRIHRAYLKDFFKLGLPIGLQSTSYPISNMIIHANINVFGVNSIAAWAVCGKLDFLIWYLADSFCITISTFVAQNYGARQYQRAKKGVLIALGMALISNFAVSSVLYFWNAPLGKLLVNDVDVVTISSQILIFLSPLYSLYVLGAVLPGAIRGTGESFKPMLITILGSCVFRVLWVFIIVPLDSSIMTVLSCYPVSWGVTSIAFLIAYFHHFSKF